ncbi:MAG: ATPase [Metallosphaera javensis (ex Sakai et al. 2022)]|nr:MAG: ATPase [Metallosphaera javensis (ex Sakai et al. 2022)]
MASILPGIREEFKGVPLLVTNMACSLFDPYPKDDRKNFFDRDELIEDVKKLVEAKFWPLLVGPKRVGKTSIVKIVTKELDGIYLDASGISSIRELTSRLIDRIETLSLSLDIRILKVEVQRKPVITLEKVLSKLGDRVLGVDEVQNIATPWLTSVLSTAYNSSDVRFIFTGSMIGMSKVLAGGGKGKSKTIKGRPIVEREVTPLNLEEGIAFLREGKRRCDVNMTEQEMTDASLTYRGIAGWLTYYGNFRSLGYDHEKSKEEVEKIALKLVKEEYERLGEIERAVLRGLSLLNSPSWRNLKKVTEALLGREVKDWSFTHALKQLINARVAKKEGENYSLVDPMYRELLKTGD